MAAPVETHEGSQAGTTRPYVPSPHVVWDDAIARIGRDAVSAAATLQEAAIAVKAAVGDLLTYESAATEVGMSVPEIFEQRPGVCQDYSHLALATYRSLGIPARYVSGYLYALDSASGDQPEGEEEINVSTHAWVEVAVPGHGWWGLDPTNQKIGHGRDYEDVTPLRGVYHGEAESGGLEVGARAGRKGLEYHEITPRPPYEPRQTQQQQQ